MTGRLRGPRGGRATTPATSTAKAKYELDAQIAEAGRRRCADLLARHRLYPEIEL